MTSLQQQYQRDGFVIAENLLEPTDVDAVVARITDIEAGRGASFPPENIEFEPPGVAVGGLSNANARGTRTGEMSAAETPSPLRLRARKINQCAEHDATFMALARDSRVLDVVQQFLGPDIKLFGSQCFMKPPGGVEKPYHQDSAYFTIEPLALVTCWLALDDVTQDNGCLWVIPGSHRGEVLDHSQPWQIGDRVDMQVPDHLIDRSRETAITMAAGSCSFHHSKLLHRSGPNQTDRPRRGLAIHYMSARSRWTHPTRPQPNYKLLRGQEHEGCV